MTNAQTLFRHRDIQSWVSAHNGMPAMRRDQSSFGEFRCRLALKFEAMGTPHGMPKLDQGLGPVSWNAWLAELDRQHLALRVSDDGQTEYELIDRKALN